MSTEDTGTFDLDGAWHLDERVSIRPERFGALLYHFGTRGLSFLKSPMLLAVRRPVPVTIGLRRPPERACGEDPLAGFLAGQGAGSRVRSPR